MAHACLKQRAVLTKDQAIEIFRLSLTHSSNKKRPTAVSVSRAFNISEKTVRDIWSARTWHDDTLPLDVNRTPRPAKKIGRPPGKIDSNPRKPRTVKSLHLRNQRPSLPLHVPAPPSLHPICGVQHPYSPPPSAYSPPPARPGPCNPPLFLPAQTLPRLPQQTFTAHQQHWQVAATVPCPPGSDFNPSQAPPHVRPPPPAFFLVPGLLAALLAMPPAAAASLLLAAAAAPRVL
jgi:hypothetical protein